MRMRDPVNNLGIQVMFASQQHHFERFNLHIPDHIIFILTKKINNPFQLVTIPTFNSLMTIISLSIWVVNK